MMNWRLLCNPYFLMLAAGNAVVFVSSLTYLPQLRNICSDKGLDLAQTANVITILATITIVTIVTVTAISTIITSRS